MHWNSSDPTEPDESDPLGSFRSSWSNIKIKHRPDAYEGICSASSVAYHALKGGTIHMTRHLAVYWAKDQVRVNCLSPGAFPSSAAPQKMVDRLEAKCPMGRMGDPSELKGIIVFLASDASSYMTGQNVTVDGGWTAW